MYQAWAEYLPIKELADNCTAVQETEMKGRGAGPSPFNAKVLLKSLLSVLFSLEGTGRLAVRRY